jgi:hypothetical protein
MALPMKQRGIFADAWGFCDAAFRDGVALGGGQVDIVAAHIDEFGCGLRRSLLV